MSTFNNVKLFGETSLSDIFKQIHKNNKDIDKQIEGLINAIKPLATQNPGTAIGLMPVVKDLIDVNVKNNDQLVKMAAIAQRAASNSSSESDLINYDELQHLLEEQNKTSQEAIQLENKVQKQLK